MGGRPEEADRYYPLALEDLERLKQWREASQVARELSQVLRALGRFEEAYDVLNRGALLSVRHLGVTQGRLRGRGGGGGRCCGTTFEQPEDLAERTRGLVRNPDWTETVEDLAAEGADIADELEQADEDRLRALAAPVRRIATGAATAREAIRLVDRTRSAGRNETSL